MVQVIGPNGLLVAASVLGSGSNPLSDADAYHDLAFCAASGVFAQSVAHRG